MRVRVRVRAIGEGLGEGEVTDEALLTRVRAHWIDDDADPSKLRKWWVGW